MPTAEILLAGRRNEGDIDPLEADDARFADARSAAWDILNDQNETR